jgi:hypothetical protein
VQIKISPALQDLASTAIRAFALDLLIALWTFAKLLTFYAQGFFLASVANIWENRAVAIFTNV